MVLAARVVAILLAIVEGAWMTFDGSRALIVGDYVTPASRPGELGPWHYAVEAIGVGPRSTLMKILFVLFGIAWIAVAIGLARRVTWAPRAALILAIGTLWYAPVGTVAGLIQIALFFIARRTVG